MDRRAHPHKGRRSLSYATVFGDSDLMSGIAMLSSRLSDPLDYRALSVFNHDDPNLRIASRTFEELRATAEAQGYKPAFAYPAHQRQFAHFGWWLT
jgi:hypothetical protein